MSWKRYHHRVGWPVGWPPSSTQNHQPRPLVATWLPHPRVASFCRWATYKTTCEDTRGEGRGWVGRWLDGPGPKVLDGAFGALFFFFRFFLSGEGKEKTSEIPGGGEAMPSEGTREVAVFLLFLLFSTFLGGGFYSIFLCRNFCKIYHIRLIGWDASKNW